MEVKRSVSEIRLGPGFNSYSQERRSLGWRWKDPSRRSVSARGRNNNFERRSPSKKMIRARVGSSLRSPSFRAAASLPIGLWILTSQAQRLQCQRASPADRLSVDEHVHHRAVERLDAAEGHLGHALCREARDEAVAQVPARSMSMLRTVSS